jgi:acetyltransferase-like isoleucine patch superfamily enzyme
MTQCKPGDLVKFGRINGHTVNINNKIALYLGEDFIHRGDGVVVENHKVLIMGDSAPTIIDRGLVSYMTKVVKDAN